MSKSDNEVNEAESPEPGVEANLAPGGALEASRIREAYEASRRRRLAIELDRALAQLRVDRVRELLTQGAGFYAEGNAGESALWRAMNRSSMEWGKNREACEQMVEALLTAGADPNEFNGHSESPLHSAAYFAHEGLARILIEHGARVNALDREGNFPAHQLAAIMGGAGSGGEGYLGLARVLAMAGARFKEPNRSGETPIDLSRKRGNVALVEAMEAWEESRELSDVLPERQAQSKPSMI